MLIDDITIRIRAGSGGKGAALFNKNLNQYGPVGGSGGDGGDIYFVGSSDLSILSSYRFKKEFSAKNGQNGKGQFRDGSTQQEMIEIKPKGPSHRFLVTRTHPQELSFTCEYPQDVELEAFKLDDRAYYPTESFFKN